MRSTTIYENNGWRVVSYGGGTAYTLSRGDLSVCLQGDDAEGFREATMGDDGFWVDNVEERFADYADVMDEGGL